jgi:hypothetical protein
VGNTRPDFFDKIANKAKKRWDQLEQDPELAAPWWQLFSQVQSPRHVLSELLQNADDAKASWAKATIEDDTFIFEYNGEDFSESDLASICKFGYSNKRQLHTIGFRGIGFKSTFSLGDTVHVRTPSLSFKFNRERFTEPHWDSNALDTSHIYIQLKIKDDERRISLEENFTQWSSNPASLLFFRNISHIDIAGQVISKSSVGEGPVTRSEWIDLSGREVSRVLVVRSDEEEFPPDALDEVRKERMTEDIDLPPCSIDIVYGLEGRQRLYAILPTDVLTELPFSCNAPFIQDPARTGIKDPHSSPTNRWLVRRCADLLTKTMTEWLGNRQLELAERAVAYNLLPPVEVERKTIADSVAWQIKDVFKETFLGKEIILTSSGEVVRGNSCLCPPANLFKIWEPEEILDILGSSHTATLSREISENQRKRLVAWKWIHSLERQDVVRALDSSSRVARPNSMEKLLVLWIYMEPAIRSDWKGDLSPRLSIVPNGESPYLKAAAGVINPGDESDPLVLAVVELVKGLISTIDLGWLKFLKTQDEPWAISQANKAFFVLEKIGLKTVTPIRSVIEKAFPELDEKSPNYCNTLVSMAHALAAADSVIPKNFPYVCADGTIRKPEEDVLSQVSAEVFALLPESWIDEHELDDRYCSKFEICNFSNWKAWVSSSKSGLRSFARPSEIRLRFRDKEDLRDYYLKSGRSAFPQLAIQTQDFLIQDYDFPEELYEHWKSLSLSSQDVWARVLRQMLIDSKKDLNGFVVPEVRQWGARIKHKLDSEGLCAEWIHKFKLRECLFDTDHRPHNPATLLLRNPKTEPLMGLEAFVHNDLDREETKQVLQMLGVRDSPESVLSIVDRIRQLASGSPADIAECIKWYQALDRMVARLSNEEFANQDVAAKFINEELILGSNSNFFKASEIYCEPDPDLPDEPLIHPALSRLPLWRRVGVALCPSVGLLVDRALGLSSGSKLSDKDLRWVKKVLKRAPATIISETKHWLSVNGCWQKVENFQWKISRSMSSAAKGLFPAYQKKIADVSMLDDSYVFQAVLEKVPWLQDCLKHVVSAPVLVGELISLPWIARIGGYIAQIQSSDFDKACFVRQRGELLKISGWQIVQSLNIIPYIENSPVGAPISPAITWSESTIYSSVKPGAKYAETIISELAKPFADDEITEAIRFSVFRDDDSISDYFQSHFELLTDVDSCETDEEDTPVTSPDTSDEDIADSVPDLPIGEVSVIEDVELPGDDEDNPLEEDEEGYGETWIKKREKHTLFSQYAAHKGFKFVDILKIYVHQDGSVIRKGDGGFSWVLCSADGEHLRNFFVYNKSFDRSLEMPTQVWEYLRQRPEKTAIIFKSNNNSISKVDGEDFVRKVDCGDIEIYPSAFNFVKVVG